MNPYVFQGEFFTLHYQIMALPFYIMAGAAGLAKLVELCGIGQLNQRLSATLGGVFVLILIPPLFQFDLLLDGKYTFMQEFRVYDEHRALVPENCALSYVTIVPFSLLRPDDVWYDVWYGRSMRSAIPTEELISKLASGEIRGRSCNIYLHRPRLATNPQRT